MLAAFIKKGAMPVLNLCPKSEDSTKTWAGRRRDRLQRFGQNRDKGGGSLKNLLAYETEGSEVEKREKLVAGKKQARRTRAIGEGDASHLHEEGRAR